MFVIQSFIMKDKPDLPGIRADGFGVGKGLLEDPLVQSAIEVLRSRIDDSVNSTAEKIDDDETTEEFRKAVVETVVNGLKKAVEKD